MRLVLFYDAGQGIYEWASYAWEEFKTSTGAEIRFFMPVLNVPFRLIFAHNPQREGVLDNNLVARQAMRVQVCRGPPSDTGTVGLSRPRALRCSPWLARRLPGRPGRGGGAVGEPS